MLHSKDVFDIYDNAKLRERNYNDEDRYDTD